MPEKSSIDSGHFKSWYFWSKLRKFRKFSKNDNSIEKGAPALRVIRAGTRLTVHRSLPYQNTIELGQSGAAHAGSFDHENLVFDEKTFDESSKEWHNKFKLCIKDLDGANKIAKWQCHEKVLLAWSFSKVSIFSRHFENFEKSWKFQNLMVGACLLYELSEREQGWRFTARCHRAGSASLEE